MHSGGIYGLKPGKGRWAYIMHLRMCVVLLNQNCPMIRLD